MIRDFAGRGAEIAIELVLLLALVRAEIDAIAEAAAHLSEVLGLGLIITGTAGGNTARHVSSFRPHARIAAMTSNDAVARRAAILWGVDPYVVATYSTFEELIDIAQQHALAEGLASPGDTVAIVETRPQSRRKRWNLVRIVRKAAEV